jgi:hypothetical protein
MLAQEPEFKPHTAKKKKKKKEGKNIGEGAKAGKK